MNRDLKPENLLFETKEEDSAIKVIDFGTSMIFKRDDKMSQPLGTVMDIITFELALLYRSRSFEHEI